MLDTFILKTYRIEHPRRRLGHPRGRLARPGLDRHGLHDDRADQTKVGEFGYRSAGCKAARRSYYGTLEGDACQVDRDVCSHISYQVELGPVCWAREHPTRLGPR